MSADPSLFAPLLDSPFLEDLENRLRRDERGIAVAGLVEGARALVLTLLSGATGRKLLLIVPDDVALTAYQRDLAAFAALTGRKPGSTAALPALDANPYDGIAAHPEATRERVVTLGRLARGDFDILLVPARALLSWMPSPDELLGRTRAVTRGDDLSPDRLILESMGAGYRRVETVSAAGEVSRRGGIVDIYPVGAEEPVRIEFFGDTVDSLRTFDTDHQRSTGPLESTILGPAVENPPTDEAIARLSRYLDDRVEAGEHPTAGFRERLETLQGQGYFPGLEALTALISAKPSTLFEHATGLTVVVDEPGLVGEEIARASAEIRNTHEESGERVLPPPDRLFASPVEIDERIRAATLFLQELIGEEPEGASTVAVSCRRSRAYAGRIPELVADLKKTRDAGTRTLCVMRAPGTAERLGEILGEYDLHPPVLVGGLRAGFELPDQGMVVLAEKDVFGDEAKPAAPKRQARAAFVSDFRDLKVGDFIVHVDHGVARYAGLGRPKGGSLNRDFMVLEFAGGDRLFVPEDRLDTVQKYSGVAGRKPSLDRLGGPGWERIKSKVRKSVESMARDLLALYARRKAVPGHAFSTDTAWQNELESAFPFELTVDQVRALEELKRDMETARPMDRLLVGDVGFGKTELAVRAAFKAVMDGRQVAVLTPTTVLAAQHANTFRDRLAPFPVRVETVSRFRTAGETRKVLRAVERGEVDVLIGTHRLLSKDVGFKRLGLLVVDEEQRFGVAHKERLKKMSVGIDVLSMTATPIPRTLQMSLAGVRDLSIIETPPPGRMAIQTYLVPFRKSVMAQAIRQELRRSGQVFVVHNRVETIPSMARLLGEIAPDARIAIAHGQMPERELERVMLRFVRDEADILLTTTIIENGLDIPRANTIIVNRADRFGLAQLYQLRGRVGRSDRHAYAFFLVPGRQTVSDVARRRLRALQEFSELGSGFRLAAADLEIRGAGELLGSRQHGHIAALGFDLYCQMLEQAVHELQGEPVVERKPVSLHLGVDIKLPQSYMTEVGDRLALYKRLSGAREESEVDRFEAETEDRFGHLPAPGRNLFDLARLRIVAEAAGVRGVDIVEAKIQIRFHDRPPVEPARVVEIVARERGRITPSGLVVVPAPGRASDRIRSVRTVLSRILGQSTNRA